MIHPRVCMYCLNGKRLKDEDEDLFCMAGIVVSAEKADRGIVIWKGNWMMDMKCGSFTRVKMAE